MDRVTTISASNPGLRSDKLVSLARMARMSLSPPPKSKAGLGERKRLGKQAFGAIRAPVPRRLREGQQTVVGRSGAQSVADLRRERAKGLRKYGAVLCLEGPHRLPACRRCRLWTGREDLAEGGQLNRVASFRVHAGHHAIRTRGPKGCPVNDL
jgi:hypothetical protein